jgi:excisionase family DNA binding protein
MTELPPKPMSRAAAAQFLGVSTRTIDRLIERAELRAFHIGRRVLVDAQAVAALVKP